MPRTADRARATAGDLAQWLRCSGPQPVMDKKAVLPTPPQPGHSRWRRRWLLAAGLAAALALLIRYDLQVMSWRYRALPKEPSGGFKQLLYGLRDFGQMVPIVAAAVIVFLTDRRRFFFLGALTLALVTGALAWNLPKWLLPRYRPEALVEEVARPRFAAHLDTAENLTPDQAQELEGRRYAEWLSELTWRDAWNVPPGPQPAARESFPSGHSGGAFAFASVLAWFYPHLRWVFWTLAAGCAGSRVIDGAHWPSDCAAGALLGYWVGWMSLRPYAWVLPLTWLRRAARPTRVQAEAPVPARPAS